MIYLNIDDNETNIPLIYADSFFKRFKGLMFKKDIKEGLFFSGNSVHMFFMKEPIDILILNKKSKIIGLYENAKPWRFAKIKTKGKIIIELPQGSIQKHNITENSNIYFKVDKKKKKTSK